MDARKLFAIALVLIGMCALLAPVAQAQLKQGDLSFSLNGGGTIPKSGDGSAISGDVQFNFMVTEAIQLSLEQSVSYSRLDGSGDFSGTTAAGGAWLFTIGQFQFGPEAFIGVGYGGSASVFAEGGAKGEFWLTHDLGTGLRADYEWGSDTFDNLAGNRDKGQFALKFFMEYKF